MAEQSSRCLTPPPQLSLPWLFYFSYLNLYLMRLEKSHLELIFWVLLNKIRSSPLPPPPYPLSSICSLAKMHVIIKKKNKTKPHTQAAALAGVQDSISQTMPQPTPQPGSAGGGSPSCPFLVSGCLSKVKQQIEAQNGVD